MKEACYFAGGGAMSLMMNSFSPGLIRPSSRRASSSMAAGSSRSRRASSRRAAFSDRRRAISAASSIVLLCGPSSSPESLIADERVHDEHADDKEEQPGENAVAAGLRPLQVAA